MSDEKEVFTPPPMKHLQYVKNIRTSRVMIATPELAKRGDMAPCQSNGQLLTGHTVDVNADAKPMRVSKYVGFMENGRQSRLFTYTELLAAKPGAIPVDDPAEWGGDTSNVVALVQPGDGEQKPTGINPALSRDVATMQHHQALIDTAMVDEESVDGEQVETGEPSKAETQEPVTDGMNIAPIPDISGIEDEKEAKDLLKTWAMANFEIQLDGRLGVQKMLSECEAMIAPPADQQAAG